MCGKTRNVKMQKHNNLKCGKSGFTLVELCIVMTLLAIVTAMIISFSLTMNKFSSQSKAEYDFLEEYSTLKEELCHWIAENDVSGAVFSTTADDTGAKTKLTVNGGEVIFAGGILRLGEKQTTEFEQIEKIVFKENGKLIKCSVTSKAGKVSSFVFSLRCGSIGGDGNE